MNANGYLVLNRDITGKGITAKSGSLPDDNYCRTKDYISTNFNVNTSAIPYSSYTNNRYPRYEDVTGICPTCSFATSIGNTDNCSSGTATKYIFVNSNCGNYELRLEAIGNGAVTTAWKQYCCSGGPVAFGFTGTPVGTYRVEIRPQAVSGTTCISQYSSSFNVCCNINPTWVNNGSTFCGNGTNGTVCHLYQPQIDTNFCSTSYQTTRNVDLGLNDSCGTWSGANYCPNYGVYPFQLRYRETNSCTGNTRNDVFVADLSPTCGYSCSYWGLSVSVNSSYCNGTTSTSGVVILNMGSNNGGIQARLVSMGSGVTTGWQTSNIFTGVADGQYYAEVRSTGDNSCTASTGFPYIFLSCYVAPTTTIPPTTTTTTTPPIIRYYQLTNCNPGGANAYTTITPDFTNQAYVLPSSTYYTYNGSYVDSSTPPSGYNASIQKTNATGCPL